MANEDDRLAWMIGKKEEQEAVIQHRRKLAELELKTAEAKLARAEHRRDEAAAQADVARMLREHVAANIDKLELPKFGGGSSGGAA